MYIAYSSVYYSVSERVIVFLLIFPFTAAVTGTNLKLWVYFYSLPTTQRRWEDEQAEMGDPYGQTSKGSSSYAFQRQAMCGSEMVCLHILPLRWAALN